MTTAVCYSDHNEDIRTKGSCDYCGSDVIDPVTLPCAICHEPMTATCGHCGKPLTRRESPLGGRYEWEDNPGAHGSECPRNPTGHAPGYIHTHGEVHCGTGDGSVATPQSYLDFLERRERLRNADPYRRNDPAY